ncbi:hypothetical protein GCM10008927_26140 [Amylibacter ulvae]|uniref:Phospholipid-binding lipoprotein MlaA n=1 Tax=Paramylibacter ulvae TaxID=1651968 RepID=A0ABQ3D6F1_9RHOB|nr:hypothetical protein GCM10008927_26140 [Amylibacter ulvae]
MLKFKNLSNSFITKLPIAATIIAVSACSDNPTGSTIVDPYEADNRKAHAFNKAVDKALFKPAGESYGNLMTEQDDMIINNVVENLSTPKKAVNNLLQANLEGFVENTLRFSINSTLGLFGYFDVAAQDFGLPARHTDFGQTLHKWGFGEGRYQELPLLGPSTGRDTVGFVADIFLDPVGAVTSPAVSLGISTVKGIEFVGDRHTYADLIDGVLYESEDSYAASRIYYLQNRRFFLNGGISEADLEDPYADE